MKQSNNPIKYRYHAFRGRLIQPLFWALCFLSPILNIFRVDMVHQRLIELNKSLPFTTNYMMWLPIGFYGLVILIGIISFIWGRLFCGWVCPHNTLTEWLRPLRAMMGRAEQPLWMKRQIRKVTRKASLNRAYAKEWIQLLLFGVSIIVALGLTTVLSLLLSMYVVSPDWLWHQYASGHPHIALVFGNGLLVLIGLFLLVAGNDFCRMCCPYGLAQSASAYHEGSSWRPMEIQFTGDKNSQCKTCQACQSVCPVDIDPRDGTLKGGLKVGQFDGCFNCGECVDACKQVHAFKRKPGLLSFQGPGFGRKRMRNPSEKQTLPLS